MICRVGEKSLSFNSFLSSIKSSVSLSLFNIISFAKNQYPSFSFLPPLLLFTPIPVVSLSLVVNSDLFFECLSTCMSCSKTLHPLRTPFCPPWPLIFTPEKETRLKYSIVKILSFLFKEHKKYTLLSAESGVAAFASFVKLDKSEGHKNCCPGFPAWISEFLLHLGLSSTASYALVLEPLLSSGYEYSLFSIRVSCIMYFPYRISMETAAMGGMAGFQYIAPNHIIKTQLH